MSLPPFAHKNSGMVLPRSTPYQNISWKARGYGKSYQNIHNCRRVSGRGGFGRFRKGRSQRRRRGGRGTDATLAPFVRRSGSQGQTGAELLEWSMAEKNGSSLSTAYQNPAGRRESMAVPFFLSALRSLGRKKWVWAPARKTRLAADGKPNALLAPPVGG